MNKINQKSRTVLKNNYKTRKEVVFEIDRISNEIKTKFKRNTELELVLSELGSLKQPILELVAYYDNNDIKMKEDLEFVKTIV